VAIGNLPELEEVLGVLAQANLPLLETLTLIDSVSTNHVYEIDELLAQLTLRRLGARKVVWATPVPQLRELWVEPSRYDDVTLELIGRTMPNLEELTIDGRRDPAEPQALAELLGRLPALKRLRLLNHRDPQRIVAALTPPPPQLEVLDLSHSNANLGSVSMISRWPTTCGLVAVRTNIAEDAVGVMQKHRSVVASSPPLHAHQSLRDDTGGDSWYVWRAKTAGLDALRIIPNGGQYLIESVIRRNRGDVHDLAMLDLCLALPCEWHVWPWAIAASAQSWRHHYELAEQISREGLMREPREPNFHASIVYCLRKQGRFKEAVAEVPRAYAALLDPPLDAQATGSQLCLIECMMTLGRGAHERSSFAAALALADCFPKLDDQNLQAMRSMCHVAAGDRTAAKAALDKAGALEGAASYVLEPARRSIYDHAIAAFALMPETPIEPGPGFAQRWSEAVSDEAIETAFAALERAWPVYPEREWFRGDPNLFVLGANTRNAGSVVRFWDLLAGRLRGPK
jgi:tetratricopeptide (TPR) repeat protein